MTKDRRWHRWLGAIGGVLLLASCSSTDGSATANKAGASDSVVLTMANYTTGLNFEPAAQYFVDQVESVSNGALRIDVTNGWGDSAEDIEGQVVRDVAAGKADLAWVSTRAFDTMGVDSLRALNAPMLIDSYPVQQAVLASHIPDEMLGDLAPLGVTAVTMLADGLRKPISVDAPLLSPTDFGGLTFSTLASTTVESSIKALGAQPRAAWGSTRKAGLGDGTIDGFELSLLHYTANDIVPLAPYVAANVNLWASPVVVIANPARLKELDARQQDWITQAATAARAKSTDLANHDDEWLARLCTAGARFADATADDLNELHTAFDPVYDELAKDAPTASFIDQIETIKERTDPGPSLAVPGECTRNADVSSSTPPAVVDPAVVNGIYRWELTEDEINATAGINPVEAALNAGTETWTLDDGSLVYDLKGPQGNEHIAGTYRISGDHVEFYLPGEDRMAFTWTRDGDGTLHLTADTGLDPLAAAVIATKPWQKIG